MPVVSAASTVLLDGAVRRGGPLKDFGHKLLALRWDSAAAAAAAALTPAGAALATVAAVVVMVAITVPTPTTTTIASS